MLAILATVGMVLLWILGILGVLLLLLLVVPLDLMADGWISGLSGQGQAKVRWGFGVFSVRVSSRDGFEIRVLGLRVFRRTLRQMMAQIATEKSGDPEAKKDNDGRKAATPETLPKTDHSDSGRRQRRRGFGSLRTVLWRISTLSGAARRVLRSIWLRGVLRGTLGLGDPSDMAMIDPVLEWLRRREGGFDFAVATDWTEEVVILEGRIHVIFWPVWTLLTAVWVLLDRDVREALRSV